MYRVVPNASREEREMGYVWDLQVGDAFGDGRVYWRSFIAYKTRYDALIGMREMKRK